MTENIVFKLFTWIFLIFTDVQGTDVTLAAYPQQLKVNLTEAAAMRCDVSNSGGDDIRHIQDIFVTRGGADVASVSHYSPAVPLADTGNLQVKGEITGTDGSEGYLLLTWSTPALTPLGEYTCTVSAVDPRGHHVVLTSQLELTAVQPTLADVIEHFNNKDQKLKGLVEDQDSKLKHQQQEIDTQRQQLDQLKACTKPRVAFTAVLATGFSNRLLTVATGKPVIYDKVILNEGSSYNSATGVFICPEDGIYTFSAHAHSYDKEDLCVELQLNSVIVDSMKVYDTSYTDSGSLSAVLHLKKGDEVRVWTKCKSEFKNYPPYGIYPNIFTGMLTQADSCVV